MINALSDVSRLLRPLRRYWWLLLGVLLIGAALGAASDNRDRRMRLDFVVVDDPAAKLAASVEDLSVRIPRKTLDRFAPEFGTKAYERGLRAKTSGVRLSVAARGGSLQFRLSAQNARNLIKASDTVTADVVRRWNAESTPVISETLKLLALRIADRRDNAKQINGELKTIQLGSPYGDSLGRELQRQRAALDRLQLSVATLTRYLDGPGIEVDRGAISDPYRGSVGRPALAGVAAVLAAAGILMLLDKKDERLETVADVERVAGEGSVIGTVDQTGNGSTRVVLAARNALGDAGGGLVAVVPLGGELASESVARETLARQSLAHVQEIASKSGEDRTLNIQATEHYPHSEEGLTHALQADAVFLAVQYGSTRADEVRDALRAFGAIGCQVAGIILCVPAPRAPAR